MGFFHTHILLQYDLFNCYKFRTMRINADADTKEAQLNDQRITTVGKWLRNKYIDELPRLPKVLAGDMSIAGPRPHMISPHFKFCSEIPLYDYRHIIKPGITCLSQVKGYHGAMLEKYRILGCTKQDRFNLQKMSFGLDLIILVKTLFIVFPFNSKK
jgi:putative colanic acid biosynthesis UDP-glucose lipid carrier transferase